MSVNSDPLSADYGQITVLELPSDNAVAGPGQVANRSERPAGGQCAAGVQAAETRALSGNLLTLPLGDGLLYVQPIYTQRGGTGSFPILQYVLTSIDDQVGIGTSFESSFADALGLESNEEAGGQDPETVPPPGSGAGPDGGPGGGPGDGPGSGPPQNQTDEERLDDYLQRASAAFEQAQAALNEDPPALGDYQRLNQEGLDWLERAVDLREQMESEGGSSGGAGSGDDGTGEGGTDGDGTDGGDAGSGGG